MGYSHGFIRRSDAEPPDAYGRLLLDTKAILEACADIGLVLVEDYEKPDSKPQLSEGSIVFNGVGDDGHETFVWYADDRAQLRAEIEWAVANGNHGWESTGGKLNGPEIMQMLVAVQASIVGLMVNEYTETCAHLP